MSDVELLDTCSGASAVRDLVNGHGEELDGVLLADSESLRNGFSLFLDI